MGGSGRSNDIYTLGLRAGSQLEHSCVRGGEVPALPDGIAWSGKNCRQLEEERQETGAPHDGRCIGGPQAFAGRVGSRPPARRVVGAGYGGPATDPAAGPSIPSFGPGGGLAVRPPK